MARQRPHMLLVLLVTAASLAVSCSCLADSTPVVDLLPQASTTFAGQGVPLTVFTAVCGCEAKASTAAGGLTAAGTVCASLKSTARNGCTPFGPVIVSVTTDFGYVTLDTKRATKAAAAAAAAGGADVARRSASINVTTELDPVTGDYVAYVLAYAPNATATGTATITADEPRFPSQQGSISAASAQAGAKREADGAVASVTWLPANWTIIAEDPIPASVQVGDSVALSALLLQYVGGGGSEGRTLLARDAQAAAAQRNGAPEGYIPVPNEPVLFYVDFKPTLEEGGQGELARAQAGAAALVVAPGSAPPARTRAAGGPRGGRSLPVFVCSAPTDADGMAACTFTTTPGQASTDITVVAYVRNSEYGQFLQAEANATLEVTNPGEASVFAAPARQPVAVGATVRVSARVASDLPPLGQQRMAARAAAAAVGVAAAGHAGGAGHANSVVRARIEADALQPVGPGVPVVFTVSDPDGVEVVAVSPRPARASVAASAAAKAAAASARAALAAFDEGADAPEDDPLELAAAQRAFDRPPPRAAAAPGAADVAGGIRRPARRSARRRAPAQVVVAWTGSDSVAWVDLRRTAPGASNVSVEGVFGVAPLSYADGVAGVGLEWALPDPSKVLIAPRTAYRRCGEPITIVASVVDAAGVPVANANVTFGVRGSCVPQVDSQVKTTDAAGFVSITLVSSKPGVVVVIAATTNAAGDAVTSHPATIVFEDKHHKRSYARRDWRPYTETEHQAFVESAHTAALAALTDGATA